MTATPRPVGHHHGDLRNALEQAALELVTQRGANGFSLSEASRRAGVTKAAPYRHYADREDLLASLVLRCYRMQEQRFGTAMESASDPADALAAFARAYVQFAADESALFQLTFGGSIRKQDHPDVQEAGDRLLHTLTEKPRALGLEAERSLDLVRNVAASSHGFAVFHLEGVIPDLSSALDAAEVAARHLASDVS